MDREEFIKKQLRKFGCFNELNYDIWKEDYTKSLSEPNIDFDRLDAKIIKDWDSTYNAPSTKWMYEAKKDCIPQECGALKRIHEIQEQAAPPPPEVVARMEALRKKVRAI